MAVFRSLSEDIVTPGLNLQYRDRRAELMDDPSLGSREHRAALRGLGRLNRLSGAAAALWRAVRRQLPDAQQLRLLDVACGGGDILAGVARCARAAGVDLTVVGVDVSSEALATTEERLAGTGTSARVVQADVLADGMPESADVVACSLFLHHLADEQAVDLLRAMGGAAERLLVVDDLVRGVWGHTLAAVVPRLVTRSPIVHVDALRSVRAAFTTAEMRDLAAAAGLHQARVVNHWPARQLLTAVGRGQS